MYLFDFRAKLKKLNPLLYVYVDDVRRVSGAICTTGIYLRQPKKSKVVSRGKVNRAEAPLQKLLDDRASGARDAYIGPVGVNYVPEYDMFDLDRERILLPGWRSIVRNLVDKGLCTLDHARKVFKCRSLMESDWDQMSFTRKLQWAKGDRPER